MSTDTQSGDDTYLRFLIPVVLVIATFVAYSNSFRGPFILDDIAQILQRKDTHSFDWGVFSKRNRRAIGDATFALNGSAATWDGRTGHPDPFGYHVVNLLVHMLAGLALFGVIRRTLLLPAFATRYTKTASGFAGAVALLWLLHPLQTQSVTYIVQRYEALMGLFYLLTFYCSIRSWTAAAVGRWLWLVAAVLACALGMWTKAVMVTAPVAIILFDIVFLAGGFSSGRLGGVLKSRLPLYAGLFATLTILFQINLVSGVLYPKYTGPRKLRGGGIAQAPTVGFGSETSSYDYAKTQPYVILRYLKLSVLPVGQSLDYKDLSPSDFGLPLVIATGAVILALLSVALAGLFRPRLIQGGENSVPWFAGTLLLFFVFLAPTSSIVPIKDLIFEHRMYLSLAPLLVLLVVGGHQLLLQFAKGWSPVGPLIVVALALGATTYVRNLDYADEERLWQDVCEKRPRNWRAWSHLGNHYNMGGEKKAREAVAAYAKGLAVITAEEPDNLHDRASFMANLGTVFEYENNLPKAIEWYEKAIATREDYAIAYMNLGNALMKSGREEEALASYRKSLEFERRETPWLNYAASLGRVGRSDEALAELNALVKRYSKSPAVRERLAKQLHRAKRHVEQEQHARKGVELSLPNSPARRGNLFQVGLALQMQGRLDDAIAVYYDVLKIRPDIPFAAALTNLSSCLMAKGRNAEAIPYLVKSVGANPQAAQGNYFLGKALVMTGKYKEAIPHLQRAFEASPTLLHAQVLIAEALLYMDRVAEAEEAIRPLVQQNPRDRDALYALAKILLRQGLNGPAVQILENLKRGAPDFEQPQRLLEQVKNGSFHPGLLVPGS
ncbi:MAG: tetratricopeptide repeat protein [Planctomycetota bacterium]